MPRSDFEPAPTQSNAPEEDGPIADFLQQAAGAFSWQSTIDMIRDPSQNIGDVLEANGEDMINAGNNSHLPKGGHASRNLNER